ncbi:MAG: glycosyltransferase family 2 protein [Microgenomates group bacterium]|nr:glycosyltransferase family 2 protein [Microgenomates group bacterium]
MNLKLSVVSVVKNEEKNLRKTLNSVKDLADEIIVVDNLSTDKTVKIAKKYRAKIYYYAGQSEGKQKLYGIDKTNNDWILFIDADEIVSSSLKKEIKELLRTKKQLKAGYFIPFQNHYLGKPVNYGGENYQMLRLFNKKKVKVNLVPIHAGFELNQGEAGRLKNKIFHYSYRSIWQVLKKFKNYGQRSARVKYSQGERPNLRKLILNPVHMFWARFIESQGYRDGWFRLPLDLAFAYMEFITYFYLTILTIKKFFLKKINQWNQKLP